MKEETAEKLVKEQAELRELEAGLDQEFVKFYARTREFVRSKMNDNPSNAGMRAIVIDANTFKGAK